MQTEIDWLVVSMAAVDFVTTASTLGLREIVPGVTKPRRTPAVPAAHQQRLAAMTALRRAPGASAVRRQRRRCVTLEFTVMANQI